MPADGRVPIITGTGARVEAEHDDFQDLGADPGARLGGGRGAFGRAAGGPAGHAASGRADPSGGGPRPGAQGRAATASDAGWQRRALVPRRARFEPGGTEGALRRLPYARGELPPRAAQSAQRLLSLDQGLVPEPGGPEARARTALGQRRLDHDPRSAESAEARPGLLPQPRLDRWLYRRVECRHGGDLDAHTRRRADRHPSLSSEQRLFSIRRRPRRSAWQSREPLAE